MKNKLNPSLNLSCESNAFQGLVDLQNLVNRLECLNLSCESNAFQGAFYLLKLLWPWPS